MYLMIEIRFLADLADERELFAWTYGMWVRFACPALQHTRIDPTRGTQVDPELDIDAPHPTSARIRAPSLYSRKDILVFTAASP